MAALCSTFLPQSISSSQVFGETPLRTRSAGSTQPAVAAPSVVQVFASKKIQGTVVRTANDKTAAVDVKRIYAHPLYKKRITSVKTYQAHDPENKCKVGDTVTLVKCAPVSKSKRFVVADIQAARVAGAAAAAARAADAAADAAESS